MLPRFKKAIVLSDDREIVIEVGELARQADGAAVVRMGDAMLLATVCVRDEPEEGADFLPLSVEYQEKFAAAGKIPGGFMRREGKLGDHEILISRLIDRAVRPLFPRGYRNPTQINVMLVSADSEVVPDTLAALSASVALLISPSVPFAVPISEVRVARVDNKFFINPTLEVLKNADLDIIVAATIDSVLMVEGEMKGIQESDLVDAIKFAHREIAIQCRAQLELFSELRIVKDLPLSVEGKTLWELESSKCAEIYDAVCAIVRKGVNNKRLRKQEFTNLFNVQIVGYEQNKTEFRARFYEIEKKAIRDMAIREGLRLDGRKFDEVRPIASEVNYVPSAHGSALFTRGDTQSLTTVTLGSKLDEQLIDSALVSGYSKFMLHYNFPGFCTGEVKPNRGASRREIGHGNLAMRALKGILPTDSDNPYTIRVVSDILESNGSSSMATVCASSLALMDSGIPVSSAVSGIAMGLIVEGDKSVVLSDILGDEDALGDMDFKVAGTRAGITACQMDIKVNGLSYEIIKKALDQSKVGRLHILSEMEKTLSTNRSSYKSHAPKVINITINKKLIGSVIGPGGRIIQDIQKKSGADVRIEEKGELGIIQIFAPNDESAGIAERLIRDIVAEPEVGAVYKGKVKSIVEFGAFIEFMPGKDGLLHISEVRWGDRIENLSEILNEGDVIEVKLMEVDPKTGKFRLSRKVLLPRPE
jgi:polyribonucleotide nucleotidyltransferase